MEQSTCAGDLAPYASADAGDTLSWVCDGATLVDASFIELVEGDLTVSSSELSAVSLPKLQEVKGDVTITSNKLIDAVSMPVLTDVGGDLGIKNNQDKSWDLDVSALERVMGSVNINSNKVSWIGNGMPALAQVGGDMEVMYSPAYYWTGHGTAGPGDYAKLTSVGGSLAFTYCGGAAVLNLAGLKTVGLIMRIFDMSDMETLELSSLESVGGQLMIYDNEVLATLDLSSLEWLNVKDKNWYYVLLEELVVHPEPPVRPQSEPQPELQIQIQTLRLSLVPSTTQTPASAQPVTLPSNRNPNQLKVHVRWVRDE